MIKQYRKQTISFVHRIQFVGKRFEEFKNLLPSQRKDPKIKHYRGKHCSKLDEIKAQNIHQGEQTTASNGRLISIQEASTAPINKMNEKSVISTDESSLSVTSLNPTVHTKKTEQSVAEDNNHLTMAFIDDEDSNASACSSIHI